VKVYDPLRQIWVAALPEEVVRQQWLHRMIHELGYPKQLLAIEKQIGQLPHLIHLSDKIATRRIDLLCFASGIDPVHPLYPLLLLECKAELCTEDSFHQVFGYNHFVKAPFVGVATRSEIRIKDTRREQQLFQLPSYKQLVEMAKDGT
jgi:hypothetical protein